MVLADRIAVLRSASARRDQEASARVLLEARGSERYVDLLAYAQGYDPAVLSPDRLVQWAEVTDANGRTDRYEGALTVCGVPLDVPDVNAVTRRWATRPGWYVLDIWESDEWVCSEAGAEHRDAPRLCLEAVDAYHRGEVDIGVVRNAHHASAAYAAAAAYADAVGGGGSAVGASAADAASAASAASAAYAAYAASAAHAAYAAAAAAPYAAAAAAYAAAYADADGAAAAAYGAAAAHADGAAAAAARKRERQMWRADWLWHVIRHALQEAE